MAAVAERQWGVVTRAQLEQCGVSGSAVARWLAGGRLHRLHRGVYAVGHRAITVEGRMAAALFHAGPRAALSHASAAWWWKLLPDEPPEIHVSSLRNLPSAPGVRCHRRTSIERVVLRRLPVTPVARTLLDLAATTDDRTLGKAIAEADYRRLLDVPTLEAMPTRGRAGAAKLKRALEGHKPERARTRSVLEDRFLDLCEAHAIPTPEVNIDVEGFLVDAYWRGQRVVVELDGQAAHGTAARMHRDRRRDLALRVAGHTVLRYSWRQVTGEPQAVAADLTRALAP